MIGTITAYSISSAVILAVLYAAYRLLLSGANQPGVNRRVLLGIYAAALVLPLMLSMPVHNDAVQTSAQVQIEAELIPTGIVVEESASPVWPMLLAAGCVSGMMLMLIYSCMVWGRLCRIVRKGKGCEIEGSRVVLTGDDSLAPCSWMHYIILPSYSGSRDDELILNHERTHLRLGHWMDMLISQVMLIIGWFNPAAWLMRAELRRIHEFEVDNSVIEQGTDTAEYQMLLIRKAVGKSFAGLANSLNHSKLKQRITMMSKSKSSKWRPLAALGLLPVSAVGVFTISSSVFADAMQEIKDARWPHKISENQADMQAEISFLMPEDEPVMNPAAAETTEDAVAEESKTISQTILPEKDADAVEETSAQPKIEIEGQGTITYEALKNIPPETIESMSVDKQTNTIRIVLKKEGSDAKAAAQKLAEFPGGQKAMMQYLSDNIKSVPGANGRAIVQFTVEADGSISGPRLMRSSGNEDADKEALRIVASMPDWTPASDDGKPVKTLFTLPVTFKEK